MSQPPQRSASRAGMRTPTPSPATPDRASIVSHPDGYYWIATDGQQEFGPFETYEAAKLDRDAFADAAWEPGETLREAESEIGIADWIDPLTGELALRQSAPHIEED